MKKYLSKQKKWFVICGLSVLLVTIVDISKAFLMQYIIDSASSMTSARLCQLILITVAFCAATLIAYFLKNYCTQKFIQRCMTDVKRDWYGKLERKHMYDFIRQDTASYLSNFTSDVQILETDYFLNLTNLMGYAFSFVLSVFAIISIHYYFIFYIMLVCWLPILINYLWSRTITEKKIEILKRNGRFVEIVKEFLTGFEMIQIYQIHKNIRSRFDRRNEELEKARFQSRYTNDLCESCSYSASLFIWLGSLILGCYMVMRKLLTVGGILGVNQLLNNVVNPLYRFALLWNRLTASERICGKIAASFENENGSQPEVVKKETFAGRIVFENVSLSAPNHKKMVEDICLSIEKGKKYLFIGESGGGKSTAVRLLLNYFNRYEGTIFVDGTDLKTLDMDSWFQLVAVVRQQEFIFNASIRDNIQLFDDFEEGELSEVIRVSRLETLIDGLPEGLDYMLLENGANISGGERQRICLARALLRKRPILILDEATSALDSENAFAVEQNILQIQDITLIMISHKLMPELSGQYDGIIEFESGHIASHRTKQKEN